jgi:hypothetical protein
MIKSTRIVSFLLSSVLATPLWAVTASNNTTGFVDSANNTVDINVGGADFNVTSICVAVSFAKSNDSSFVPENTTPSTGTPYHNETEFVLTNPGGTSVTLISNNGGTEINADPVESFNAGDTAFQGTIQFDQGAAQVVNYDPDLPHEGTFRPHPGDLTDFLGENGAGTWEFFYEDDVGADGLSFYGVQLFLNEACGALGPSANAVAIPTTSMIGTLLLILTLVIGAGLYLRRQY